MPVRILASSAYYPSCFSTSAPLDSNAPQHFIHMLSKGVATQQIVACHAMSHSA